MGILQGLISHSGVKASAFYGSQYAGISAGAYLVVFFHAI
jgi:hypothetical protein